MAQGLFPQLKSHFILVKKHGVTKQEAIEIVTQLAFYCGWPKAWSAFALIKEVMSPAISVLKIKSQPSTGILPGSLKK